MLCASQTLPWMVTPCVFFATPSSDSTQWLMAHQIQSDLYLSILSSTFLQMAACSRNQHCASLQSWCYSALCSYSLAHKATFCIVSSRQTVPLQLLRYSLSDSLPSHYAPLVGGQGSACDQSSVLQLANSCWAGTEQVMRVQTVPQAKLQNFHTHAGFPLSLHTIHRLTTCRYSMLRIGLAPCAPFNVTQDLMKAAAKLARQYPGVRLHTHLAENIEDIEYVQKQFGCRPGEYIK